MKKSLIILVAMLLVAAVAGSSSASMITSAAKFTGGGIYGDVVVLDADTAPAYRLDDPADYITYEHLFNNYPALDDILSAELAVTLKDADEDAIDEFIIGWDRLSGWYPISGAVTGSYAPKGLYLPNLAVDPAIFTLGSDSYDRFYLRESRLAIETATTPEPGTLMLLGSGISGLAFARRKIKK